VQLPKSRAPDGGADDVAWVVLGGGAVELSATLLSTAVTVTVVGPGHDAVEAASAAAVGVTVDGEVLAAGGGDPATEAALPSCPKGNVFGWDPFRTVDCVAGSKNRSVKGQGQFVNIVCPRVVHTGIIGRILTLNKAIQLRVGRRLLAEDAVSECGRAAVELNNDQHGRYRMLTFSKSLGECSFRTA
jgi:hypothetical protein